MAAIVDHTMGLMNLGLITFDPRFSGCLRPRAAMRKGMFRETLCVTRFSLSPPHCRGGIVTLANYCWNQVFSPEICGC